MLDLSSVLSLPPPPRAAHFPRARTPARHVRRVRPRACAALPFALVCYARGLLVAPRALGEHHRALQNAAYPDVADAAATFGPRIPRAGLTGTLFLAAPLEGCAPSPSTRAGPG